LLHSVFVGFIGYPHDTPCAFRKFSKPENE
jgi:hypothetical protein